jgi:hypothetical protein
MPQIVRDYLELVFYVYDSKQGALGAEPEWDRGGTGFFVAVPFEGATSEGSLYAVTAAHVVRDQPRVFLRINKKDGNVVIVPIEQSAWQYHPSGDDIAVAPIDDSSLDVYAIPSQQFLSEKVVDLYALGIGDETFAVGRFINHEGKQRNTPAVRFGNIAMLPLEPILNPRTEQAHPAYLIETRSQSGYSGAPVFIYLVGGGQRWIGMDRGMFSGSQGPWLLGLLWGYTQAKAEKFGYPQVFQTGLAAVVPVSRLVELLGSEPLARTHREAEELWRKSRNDA